MPKISFKQSKVVVHVRTGSELSAAHQQDQAIPLKFGCKKGECGICAIKVLAGESHLTKCSPQEKKTLEKKGLGNGHRLACQCALNGDIEIDC